MTSTATHANRFQTGDEVLFQALPTHEPEEVEITTVFAIRGYGGKTIYDYGFRLLRSGTGGRAGEKQLRTR